MLDPITQTEIPLSALIRDLRLIEKSIAKAKTEAIEIAFRDTREIWRKKIAMAIGTKYVPPKLEAQWDE